MILRKKSNINSKGIHKNEIKNLIEGIHMKAAEMARRRDAGINDKVNATSEKETLEKETLEKEIREIEIPANEIIGIGILEIAIIEIGRFVIAMIVIEMFVTETFVKEIFVTEMYRNERYAIGMCGNARFVTGTTANGITGIDALMENIKPTLRLKNQALLRQNQKKRLI